MAKIVICRGIPASGKSTWAKNWVLENPNSRVRFNNDDIRNMLGKYWVPSRETLVEAIKKQFTATSMKRGYDIVIDNMNLNPKEVKYYTLLVDAHNQVVEELRNEGKLRPEDDFKYELEFKDFFTPLEECIHRDSLRENPIGEPTIREIYNKYKRMYNL